MKKKAEPTVAKNGAAKRAAPLKGVPFAKGHDPRRVIPKSPGRTPDAFKAEMRELATSRRAIEKLTMLLESDDVAPLTFLKALEHVTDRGFGKAQQHVDVTTSGQSIAEILRKGRDRVARMKAERIAKENA